MPQPAELRHFRRHSNKAEIEMTIDGRPFHGQMRNLSPGGMLVVMENPPAVGTEMLITCQSGQPVGARVVRSDPQGVGLEFLDADQAVRFVLAQMLRHSG